MKEKDTEITERKDRKRYIYTEREDYRLKERERETDRLRN
jgi:hypothetical protein